MLDALQTLVNAGLSDKALDAIIEDLLEANDLPNHSEKLCLIALSWSRNDEKNTYPQDITHVSDDCVNINLRTYRILDDDDMETAWDESLEQCGEECVEGYNGTYFDKDRWKEDAKHDGVGHSLSPYDGELIEHADYNLFRIS